MARPTRSKPAITGLLFARGRERSPVYVMHLFQQVLEMVGNTDKSRFLPVEPAAAGQAFQQPGPERIQLFDPGNVDGDAAGGLLGA